MFVGRNETSYNSFGEEAQATSSNRETIACIVQSHTLSRLSSVTNRTGNEIIFENRPTESHLHPVTSASQSAFVNSYTITSAKMQKLTPNKFQVLHIIASNFHVIQKYIPILLS